MSYHLCEDRGELENGHLWAGDWPCRRRCVLRHPEMLRSWQLAWTSRQLIYGLTEQMHSWLQLEAW